jgi:glutathionylspermidine synthase
VRVVAPVAKYSDYVDIWDRVAKRGLSQWNVDTWAGGRRYLSLAAVVLTRSEAEQLRGVTKMSFSLLNRAVDGILADRDWWSALAWPWPAIELARQEPTHPSLYGRFDVLLDANDRWQVIEYNADTPSGGREATGLEPAIARLYPPLQRTSVGLASRLVSAIESRIAAFAGRVDLIGVVSSHSWLEDMAQARWLAALLCKSGLPTLVGDVADLEERKGRITLRGRPIDALYRFYPLERLYRHAIFASLLEAAVEGRLLLLNGLRGFLAQSKACLAWLWSNRAALGQPSYEMIERHLPPTCMAREADADDLLLNGVVKHVNGREGDSVVFGHSLDTAGWEARRLEGGFVVQQRVRTQEVHDIEVDDGARRIRQVGGRIACVGAFSIGGRFAGCYTRLDGPITSARATYAATLVEPS